MSAESSPDSSDIGEPGNESTLKQLSDAAVWANSNRGGKVQIAQMAPDGYGHGYFGPQVPPSVIDKASTVGQVWGAPAPMQFGEKLYVNRDPVSGANSFVQSQRPVVMDGLNGGVTSEVEKS